MSRLQVAWLLYHRLTTSSAAVPWIGPAAAVTRGLAHESKTGWTSSSPEAGTNPLESGVGVKGSITDSATGRQTPPSHRHQPRQLNQTLGQPPRQLQPSQSADQSPTHQGGQRFVVNVISSGDHPGKRQADTTSRPDASRPPKAHGKWRPDTTKHTHFKGKGHSGAARHHTPPTQQQDSHAAGSRAPRAQPQSTGGRVYDQRTRQLLRQVASATDVGHLTRLLNTAGVASNHQGEQGHAPEPLPPPVLGQAALTACSLLCNAVGGAATTNAAGILSNITSQMEPQLRGGLHAKPSAQDMLDAIAKVADTCRQLTYNPPMSFVAAAATFAGDLPSPDRAAAPAAGNGRAGSVGGAAPLARSVRADATVAVAALCRLPGVWHDVPGTDPSRSSAHRLQHLLSSAFEAAAPYMSTEQLATVAATLLPAIPLAQRLTQHPQIIVPHFRVAVEIVQRVSAHNTMAAQPARSAGRTAGMQPSSLHGVPQAYELLSLVLPASVWAARQAVVGVDPSAAEAQTALATALADAVASTLHGAGASPGGAGVADLLPEPLPERLGSSALAGRDAVGVVPRPAHPRPGAQQGPGTKPQLSELAVRDAASLLAIGAAVPQMIEPLLPTLASSAGRWQPWGQLGAQNFLAGSVSPMQLVLPNDTLLDDSVAAALWSQAALGLETLSARGSSSAPDLTPLAQWTLSHLAAHQLKHLPSLAAMSLAGRGIAGLPPDDFVLWSFNKRAAEALLHAWQPDDGNVAAETRDAATLATRRLTAWHFARAVAVAELEQQHYRVDTTWPLVEGSVAPAAWWSSGPVAAAEVVPAAAGKLITQAVAFQLTGTGQQEVTSKQQDGHNGNPPAAPLSSGAQVHPAAALHIAQAATLLHCIPEPAAEALRQGIAGHGAGGQLLDALAQHIQQLLAADEATAAAAARTRQPQAAALEPAQHQAAATSEPAQRQAAAVWEPARHQAAATSEPVERQAAAATSEPDQPQAAATSQPVERQAAAATSEPDQPQAAATSQPVQTQAEATSKPAQPEAAATSEPAQRQAADWEPSQLPAAATFQPAAGTQAHQASSLPSWLDVFAAARLLQLGLEAGLLSPTAMYHHPTLVNVRRWVHAAVERAKSGLAGAAQEPGTASSAGSEEQVPGASKVAMQLLHTHAALRRALLQSMPGDRQHTSSAGSATAATAAPPTDAQAATEAEAIRQAGEEARKALETSWPLLSPELSKQRPAFFSHVTEVMTQIMSEDDRKQWGSAIVASMGSALQRELTATSYDKAWALARQVPSRCLQGQTSSQQQQQRLAHRARQPAAQASLPSVWGAQLMFDWPMVLRSLQYTATSCQADCACPVCPDEGLVGTKHEENLCKHGCRGAQHMPVSLLVHALEVLAAAGAQNPARKELAFAARAQVEAFVTKTQDAQMAMRVLKRLKASGLPNPVRLIQLDMLPLSWTPDHLLQLLRLCLAPPIPSVGASVGAGTPSSQGADAAASSPLGVRGAGLFSGMSSTNSTNSSGRGRGSGSNSSADSSVRGDCNNGSRMWDWIIPSQGVFSPDAAAQGVIRSLVHKNSVGLSGACSSALAVALTKYVLFISMQPVTNAQLTTVEEAARGLNKWGPTPGLSAGQVEDLLRVLLRWPHLPTGPDALTLLSAGLAEGLASSVLHQGLAPGMDAPVGGAALLPVAATQSSSSSASGLVSITTTLGLYLAHTNATDKAPLLALRPTDPRFTVCLALGSLSEALKAYAPTLTPEQQASLLAALAQVPSLLLHQPSGASDAQASHSTTQLLNAIQALGRDLVTSYASALGASPQPADAASDDCSQPALALAVPLAAARLDLGAEAFGTLLDTAVQPLLNASSAEPVQLRLQRGSERKYAGLLSDLIMGMEGRTSAAYSSVMAAALAEQPEALEGLSHGTLLSLIRQLTTCLQISQQNRKQHPAQQQPPLDSGHDHQERHQASAGSADDSTKLQGCLVAALDTIIRSSDPSVVDAPAPPRQALGLWTPSLEQGLELARALAPLQDLTLGPDAEDAVRAGAHFAASTALSAVIDARPWGKGRGDHAAPSVGHLDLLHKALLGPVQWAAHRLPAAVPRGPSVPSVLRGSTHAPAASSRGSARASGDGGGGPSAVRLHMTQALEVLSTFAPLHTQLSRRTLEGLCEELCYNIGRSCSGMEAWAAHLPDLADLLSLCSRLGLPSRDLHTAADLVLPSSCKGWLNSSKSAHQESLLQADRLHHMAQVAEAFAMDAALVNWHPPKGLFRNLLECVRVSVRGTWTPSARSKQAVESIPAEEAVGLLLALATVASWDDQGDNLPADLMLLARQVAFQVPSMTPRQLAPVTDMAVRLQQPALLEAVSSALGDAPADGLDPDDLVQLLLTLQALPELSTSLNALMVALASKLPGALAAKGRVEDTASAIVLQRLLEQRAAPESGEDVSTDLQQAVVSGKQAIEAAIAALRSSAVKGGVFEVPDGEGGLTPHRPHRRQGRGLYCRYRWLRERYTYLQDGSAPAPASGVQAAAEGVCEPDDELARGRLERAMAVLIAYSKGGGTDPWVLSQLGDAIVQALS